MKPQINVYKERVQISFPKQWNTPKVKQTTNRYYEKNRPNEGPDVDRAGQPAARTTDKQAITLASGA